jgi:hypothetical protein
MATAKRLWESSQRRNDRFMQADSLRRQAYCQLAFNRTAEASARVEQLGEIRRKEERKKSRELNSDVYLLRALVHARRGEFAAAKREAEAGAKILTESSFMFYDVLLEHSTLLDVLFTLGEAGELPPAAARTACRRLTLFSRSFPCAKPAARLCEARVAWLSGKRDKAHRLWALAAQEAEHAHLPYFEGVALFESGLRLAKSDPERIRGLSRALTILERSGERYYAGKIAEALGLGSSE